MLDIMALKEDDAPLYGQVLLRIIREMRTAEQKKSPPAPFDYRLFKKMLTNSGLTPSQLVPLEQRLDTLESFMAPKGSPGTSWNQKASHGKLSSTWVFM